MTNLLYRLIYRSIIFTTNLARIIYPPVCLPYPLLHTGTYPATFKPAPH